MRVIQLGDRADLVGLARSVLPADADGASVERAVAAIRAANPGVELDRLAPGSFVQVPTLDADDGQGPGEVAGDVSSGPLQALRGVLDVAVAELRGLAGQPSTSAADRRLIQVALKDDAVLKAAGDDQALGQALESVAAQLQADRDVKERVEQVDAIAAQWLAQLEFLTGRSVPDR